MAARKNKKTKASQRHAGGDTDEQVHLDRIEAEASTTATTNGDATKVTEADLSISPLHIDEREADIVFVEVQNTESKGQAVFATRKIKAGTLLLSEPPVIRLTQAEEDTDKTATHGSDAKSILDEHFKALPRPTQKAYLKLFDSQKSDFSRVKSIYYSNCYNLSGSNRPSKTSLGGSAVGLTASRINHACIPNVQFSFDEETGMMNFRAIKPIAKGREILSNYDSIYELRAARQRRQMLYYGFKCDCEACEAKTEFWLKSDERRRAIIEARRDIKNCENAFGEHGRVTHETDPLHALERLESMLIKEGMVGLPLADTYRSMSRWADRKMDSGNARKWRIKEREVCVTCLGEQSVRVKSLEAKIDLH